MPNAIEPSLNAIACGFNSCVGCVDTVRSVLESALAGGIVLPGRDGCCRDIAGIHRRYRKVDETMPALALVGAAITVLVVAFYLITYARWKPRRIPEA